MNVWLRVRQMILLFIIMALNTPMSVDETCLILGKFCMVLESLLRRPLLFMVYEILLERLRWVLYFSRIVSIIDYVNPEILYQTFLIFLLFTAECNT